METYPICSCGCGCEPDGDWHWTQQPWCRCVANRCPCVTDSLGHPTSEGIDMDEDEKTYKIIRFYQHDEELNKTVVTRGLTLEQAQDHCHDPESSSSTATTPEAVARTKAHGPWFDGYEEE